MLLNKSSLVLKIAAVLVYVFLYLPLFIVIIYSFNNSRINVDWVGFTLKWYYMLFNDAELLHAAANSLFIALVSSGVSVVFGTLAAVYLQQYKSTFLSLLIIIPIAAPELLVGVALLLFFIMLNFTLGTLSIMLAHIAFCISFVSIAVRASMSNIDSAVLHAARDLGATQLQAFRLILLPIILPGIIAGGLMAFTLSIDDFVITFFTAGVGSNTLPLAIYSMIKMGVTPEINAASTLIIICTLAFVILSLKISPQLFKQAA